jgi:glycosyltransferase involved in cell wall biosynthesis
MPGNKLKVLQIISNLEIGGAQEVVRTLVEHLAASDCEPIVCTFRDGPLRQSIEQLGVKVEVLPDRRYDIVSLPFFVVEMIQLLRSLTRLVKKYNVEVIQTHLLGSLNFGVLLLRYTTHVRIILWTFHSAHFVLTEAQLPRYKWLLKPKRYAHNQLYRLTSRLVSGFIAVSDEVKKNMVEILGPIQDRIVVICNGVDVERYGQPVDKVSMRSQLGLEATARLIAVVATFREPKGHRYMVEAMAALVPQHPDVHALFVGDGDLREELQTRVERLGLGEHIHFLGNRSDVPELLATSDLFVLPSLWEGLPMALIEAMAAGTPVVATAVSGTVQVMIPGETGLVVPPGNSQMLAKAILELLSDPARAQAMGIAAKQRVQAEFSAQKQADEHLTLYYRLLRSYPDDQRKPLTRSTSL